MKVSLPRQIGWLAQRQFYAFVDNWRWYRASLIVSLTIFAFILSQPVDSLAPSPVDASHKSSEYAKMSSTEANTAEFFDTVGFLQTTESRFTTPASSFIEAASRVRAPSKRKCEVKTQKWDCRSTEVCRLDLCEYCEHSFECTDFPAYVCVKPDGLKHRVCRHKGLLPKVSSADVITSVLAFIFCMMAGGGGVGGGSLLVPILVVVNRFQPHEAIPLSKATIFAGSVGNLILNVFKSHPYDRRRVLIDYETATVLEPIALYGTVVGVVFTRIFPEWVIFISLVLVLGLMSYKTIERAIKLYHTETRMMELAQRSALEREQQELDRERATRSEDGSIARISSVMSDGNGSGSERSGRPGFQAFNSDHSYVTDSDSASDDDDNEGDSARRHLAPGSSPSDAISNSGMQRFSDGGSDSEGSMRNRSQFVPPSFGPGSIPPNSPTMDDGVEIESKHTDSSDLSDDDHDARSLMFASRRIDSADYGDEYPPPEGYDHTMHIRYAPDRDDDDDDYDPAVAAIDSTIEPIPPPKTEAERQERLVEIMEFEKALHSHPLYSYVVLFIADVLIVSTMILLGGEGNGSIVGIECGSAMYWVLWGSLLPLILLIVFAMAYRTRKNYVRKVQLGFRFLRGDVQWTIGTLILYPFISFTAGLAAGMIGVGGGTIKAPLLLEMGLIPESTAATVAYMIFFTSSCTTSQFLIHGMLQYDYALWYAIIGFIATMLGQIVAQKLVDLYKRPSFLIFTIAAVTALGSAMLTVQGSFQLSDDVQHNKHMGFRDMCD